MSGKKELSLDELGEVLGGGSVEREKITYKCRKCGSEKEGFKSRGPIIIPLCCGEEMEPINVV